MFKYSFTFIFLSIFILGCNPIEKKCNKVYEMMVKCNKSNPGTKSNFIKGCKKDSSKPLMKKILDCHNITECNEFKTCLMGTEKAEKIEKKTEEKKDVVKTNIEKDVSKK
jgi:hypothetical protein